MDPSPSSPVWCAYYNGFGELVGAAPQVSMTTVLGDGEWQLAPSEPVPYTVPVTDGTTQGLVVTQEVHQSAPVQPYPDFHHDQDLSRKHEPNLTHESLLLKHNTNFVQESLPNHETETLHSYEVYPKQDSNYEQESSHTLESYQEMESSYDHLSYQKVESTHSQESSSNHQRPGKGEKIECLECQATFACLANLRNHMRIHTGERPYRCEECGASFTQRSNLRSHKRVHTGERPYMCGICGQTFARSSHLSGHMRTHTGEKPFVCPYCARSFATNQIMKNHLRTHTGERPFVCDVCQATFAQSSCLATHKKIHTGVRDFKCEQCHKAFISRSGLQTHERVHTGEKPYKCENCTKSFKTSSYLSKHKQKYCCNKSFVNKGTNLKKPVPKPAVSRKMSKSRKTVKTAGKPPKRNKSRKSQHPRRHQKSSLEQLLSTPDDTQVKQEEREIKGSQTIPIQGNTGLLSRLSSMQDFTIPTREEGNSLVYSKTDSRMYVKDEDEHLLGVTEYLAGEQGVQEAHDEYHYIEVGSSLNMKQSSSQSYSEAGVFSSEVSSSADIDFDPLELGMPSQEVAIASQEIDICDRDGSVSSREVHVATQDVYILSHKVDMKCKEVIMSHQESAIFAREVLEGVQEIQALPSVSSIARVTGVKQELGYTSGHSSAVWYSKDDM